MDRALVGLLHPLPSLATVAAALAFSPLIASGPPPVGPTLLLAVSLALQQFSISVHNDWCDRTLDARAKPWRAIPSGAITPRAALVLAAILASGSLLLALPLGPDEVALVALFLVCGFLYNLGLKRTILSWLPFSIAFPLIPLFPAAALEAWPSWWLPLAIAAQPLILAIHLADSIPDISADLHAGSDGLAARLGPTNARRVRTASLLVAGITLPVVALAHSY